MLPILVGSRALEYWSNEGSLGKVFISRTNADYDLIAEFPKGVVKPDGVHVEVHSTDELNNSELFYEFYDHSMLITVGANPARIMTLPGLALMKRSHLWRAYHFEKHISMYHKYLAEFAQWYNPTWVDTLNKRIKLTKEAYPQRNPSLKQTNDEFFDDAVTKVYEHDWIHELVSYYDRPLFERMKQEDNFDKAWCERDMWDSFSHEDKCKTVAEEAHVIACERFMIPSGWKHPEKLAYFKAINKVCTTLTSGWFRDFAIDNFPEVVNLYNPGKFAKVKSETFDKDN